MRFPFAPAVVAVAAALFLSGSPQARAADAVKLTKQENRISVEVGGKPFTDYYFGPEGGRPYVRPFMWPVHAADGTPVTSDQEQFNPKEHPHHRSLWVAHGDVGGADHWSFGKVAATPEKWDELPKQKNVSISAEGDTISQKLQWEDKDHKPMLDEARTVKFGALADGSRTVDITSVFSAVDKPVTFGSTKEAGLTSVRVIKSISDNPILTLSTGATSKENADKAKKSAGDENNVWGKEADWCDISGQINGKTYGVAILNSPSNPLTAKWHARRYGLVGANNIGAKEFDKNNPKIYTPFTIEPGKPATFKYRVIVHGGNVGEAKIAEAYKAFAGK